MATPRLLRTLGETGPHSSPHIGHSRWLKDVLAHLRVMKSQKIRDTSATTPTLALIDGVLSLSELCTQLHVSAQNDLRHPQRGRSCPSRGEVTQDTKLTTFRTMP
jgi:hypothetical protein